MKLSSFAYKIWKKLEKLSEQHFLLAVSGGRDSIVLLYVFAEIQKVKNIKVTAAHIFHGPSTDSKQLAFRNDAQDFVKDLCQKLEIPFLTNLENSAWPNTQSEESLRFFRREWLLKFKEETGAELIVQAHHEIDLLETRLIRLIRGTGSLGIFSMGEKSGFWFRPFLLSHPKEIAEYSNKHKVKWVEDPSNKNSNYLRNWLRHDWLPQLEVKRPGSTVSLARSLELLSNDISETKEGSSLKVSDGKGIERMYLRQLGTPAQRKIVAAYMQQSGLKNYRLKQVDEVIKRLNTEQKKFEFKLASHLWRVDKNHIYIVR